MLKNKYLHYVKFDGKEYEECSEITTYSNDSLIMEFKRIVEPLYTNDNLDNHFKVTNLRLPSGGDNRFYESKPDYNWYCFNVSPFAGSGAIGKEGKSFYSLLPNND